MPDSATNLSSETQGAGLNIKQVNQLLAELDPPMILDRCKAANGSWKMPLDEMLARVDGMYYFLGTVHSDEHPKGQPHYGAYDAQRHLLIGNPYLVLMLDKPEDSKRPGCNNLFFRPKPKEVEADAESLCRSKQGLKQC